MKYDAFISYRRDGGDSFAMMLQNELKSRGLKVFFDVEALRSGKFNEQLYKEIEESRKVVLVLPPNALDRCLNDERDWVRQEVTHAIKCGKDIIPITLRGFSFPPNLPEPLDQLPFYQGIYEPNLDQTFSANLDYLVKLIVGNSDKLPVDITIDMRQVKTFASCGNEGTVFKVKKSSDGQAVSFQVNFEKTRIRDEIPEYAGVYYIKHPVIDISKNEKITFEARSDDLSIVSLWIEIKPEGKAWMHESFEVELGKEFEKYEAAVSDFEYPETATRMEEITFVIKPSSFADEHSLKGNLEIRNIKIV